MVLRSDDTIAAIATPPGDGAIAIIRLSGPEALLIGDRVFRGNTSLLAAPGFTAHLGHIVHPAGTHLDQAIATVYRAPHSYTGEDAVEISCHGGGFLTAGVLESLLAAGARAAGPGEFTRRAFINGKLDLTQAEAVADLIASRSERARRISIEQLQGKFGEHVRQLRRQLIELCSLMELQLDFSEEGIELVSNEEIKKKIECVTVSVDGMLTSYETGKLIREGISVALVGPPNVGKSSIFNALLKHDRAIVTHIPGTTRDTIEESIVLDGITFRLTDTAGVRESADIVESKGIDRSLKAISSADMILLVQDDDVVDAALIPGIMEVSKPGRVIIVRNKSDLLPHVPPDRPGSTPPVIHVSARTEYGMDGLRSLLLRSAGAGTGSSDGGQIVTRERHRAALQTTTERLTGALSAVQSGTSTEFIALDVRTAADALGAITGEVTTEEILNTIFSSFCVGK
jgi:tRNA modification GTPase